MKTPKAIQLALDLIEAEIKTLNVEANLYDMLQADHPAAIKASRKRKELREAITILKGLLDDSHLEIRKETDKRPDPLGNQPG